MARTSITTLYNAATTAFADNSVGAITPALLRDFLHDFLDTIRPIYGGLQKTSALAANLTTTDAAFPWTAALAAPTADYSTVLGTGLITRTVGPAGATVNFSIDATAPNNSVTTFTLYTDGVVTPWGISNTSTSGTDLVSFAFSAVMRSNSATPTYQIRARSNGANTVTLSNGIFTVMDIPLNVP
jgi:hypothetical protein